MSTSSSPQVLARVSGVLYLLIIAAGLFAQLVRERLVVAGNAAATAGNITADAFLYRLSIVADLSTFVCAVAAGGCQAVPLILVPAFIGELSFALWLTVKGVNVARWPGQIVDAPNSL